MLAVALALVLSPLRARADDATTPSPAAAGAAVFPGIVLHGSGHWVANQRPTARRLLVLELAGLVVAGGAIAGLAATGASRRLVAPLATLAASGVGLFAATFLADLYGVLTPRSARGTPLLARPAITTESGVWYRYDPQFAGRALLSEAVDTVLADRHRLRLEMQALPGDPSLRVRGLVGERVLQSDNDGSFVDLEGAITHQRFPVDGFFSTTLEAAARGRLDLERVGPSLRGAFVESRLGAGISALRTRDVATDPDELLLLRMGLGAYLGHGRGEVELAYDHRRDTLAGGLLVPGIPSGYAGFVAARLQLFFGTWGVQTDLQAGSALMGGLSLVTRMGGGS